jgi:hypothetical protein
MKKRIDNGFSKNATFTFEEKLDGPLVSALRRTIVEVKQRWPVIGWVTKIYYLKFLRASEGTLSRWSWLHLQSLALNNPLRPRGGLWPVLFMRNPYVGPVFSNGDINGLMMMTFELSK